MKAKAIFLILFLLVVPMTVFAVDPLPVDNGQMGPPADAAGSGGVVKDRIINPLGDNVNDLESLAKVIGTAIVDLALPVAVIIILWIGVQFLLAGGNAEKITKARKALLWTLVGIAIILIGDGFIALIKDILSLQN